MIVDKGKQKEGVIQDEVFLYKTYVLLLESSRLLTLKPILLKEEVDNLEKALKTLQPAMKILLFLSSAHYKTMFVLGTLLSSLMLLNIRVCTYIISEI